jgi:hypothetical protein
MSTLRAPRPLAGLLAAITAASVLLAAAPVAGPAAASAAVARDPAVAAPAAAAAPATAIVPGSVNRTSIAISATYDASLLLRFLDRHVGGRVTIAATNRSGAGIDRVELNTVMGPLGGLVLGTSTVDGRTVHPTRSDQTIIVPLGGVLPDGATASIVVRFSATLRTSTTGSSWLFAKASGIVDLYRWLPWVSRRIAFARPNFGDPFVTPVSPHVHVVIRSDVPLRYATTGAVTSRSADQLITTFDASNVRDFVVSASRDTTSRQATVGSTVIRVVARSGFPAAAVLTAAKASFAKLQALLGPYPYPLLTLSESAGGYGMEGPNTVWLPHSMTSGNLRYLVTHEMAHQWFYGLVGNDQAREPFADEAMTDMVARYVLGMRRSSTCSTARLDLAIYRYSAGCYYEDVYIQGGNLLDDARRAMGTTRFFTALRGYITAHTFGIVHTRTLLDALDAATTLDLRARWLARFPSLY